MHKTKTKQFGPLGIQVRYVFLLSYYHLVRKITTTNPRICSGMKYALLSSSVFFLFLPTNLRLVMLTLCRLSRARCFLFVKRNGKNCWWELDHPPALSELPVIDEKSDLEVMLNIILQGKCKLTVCICCKKGQHHIRDNKKYN